MLVYMDRPDEARRWPGMTVRLCRDLGDLGHTVYRPDRAYLSAEARDRSDEALTQHARFQITRAALRAADGGVAFVVAGPDEQEMASAADALTCGDIPALVVTDLDPGHPLMSGWGRNPRVVVVRPDLRYLAEAVLGLQALMVQYRHERAAAAPASDRQVSHLRPLIFEPVGRCPDVAVHEGDGVMGLRSLLPSRGYHDDAGLDLVVSEGTKIPAGEFVDVPCGVKVDLPEGSWGMIVGRSSTLRKRSLLVNTGVIDAGWTGPLFAGVHNLGASDMLVAAGDRLAQLIVLPAPAVGLRPAWGQVRTDKSRGEQGFGSTGS